MVILYRAAPLGQPGRLGFIETGERGSRVRTSPPPSLRRHGDWSRVKSGLGLTGWDRSGLLISAGPSRSATSAVRTTAGTSYRGRRDRGRDRHRQPGLLERGEPDFEVVRPFPGLGRVGLRPGRMAGGVAGKGIGDVPPGFVPEFPFGRGGRAVPTGRGANGVVVAGGGIDSVGAVAAGAVPTRPGRRPAAAGSRIAPRNRACRGSRSPRPARSAGCRATVARATSPPSRGRRAGRGVRPGRTGRRTATGPAGRPRTCRAGTAGRGSSRRPPPRRPGWPTRGRTRECTPTVRSARARPARPPRREGGTGGTVALRGVSSTSPRIGRVRANPLTASRSVGAPAPAPRVGSGGRGPVRASVGGSVRSAAGRAGGAEAPVSVRNIGSTGFRD